MFPLRQLKPHFGLLPKRVDLFPLKLCGARRYQLPIKVPHHLRENQADFHVRQAFANATVRSHDERLNDRKVVRGKIRVPKPTLWPE